MEMLRLYPTWHEPILGSGWVLGVIAVIHMLASHISVGAALVATWLTTVAVRRSRPELLDYVRRYGVFLLVFSYVLGSITGPGIWFSATVASPRGLDALIHAYVWYWATEWVFFVVAVIGIVMLGGAALGLLGAFLDTPHWRRLSSAMLTTAANPTVLLDFKVGRVGGGDAAAWLGCCPGRCPSMNPPIHPRCCAGTGGG